MLLSLKWLREFTPYEISPDALADKLTMLGLEMEEWIRPFDHLRSIVVGEVLSCTAHPEADKLRLCMVDTGDFEPLQIVCGAPNVAQGQKVAVAPVNTTLPGGMTIKKAKIRGQRSFGMICSESELELSDDHTGIMVLDPQCKTGQSLIDALDLETDVFDISITPNRADCLSIFGLAREVAAAYGLPLIPPPVSFEEDGADCSREWTIEIPEGEYCPLYQGRVINNIQVKKSPSWMRYRLLAQGIRPINNIVDATNYVLMELGHPLHAFDKDLLQGNTIKVARASEGMTITTLDDQERKLTDEDLLIWDAGRPVALAGVMGGANSEIHEQSTNVLLECAVFRPATIRKTARRLGLSSEASFRFERGVDQPGSILPLNRATMLIAQLGGGTVAPGIAKGEPLPYQKRSLPFRPEKSRRFLALDLDDDFCSTTLTSLGCGVQNTSKETWDIEPPSYRLDLEREVDLFEEVGRLYGLDRVPAVLPGVSKSLDDIGKEDPTFAFHKKVKQWASGVGMTEVVNYSFVSSRELDLFGQDKSSRVNIFNPLSEDQNVMRTVLTPGLMQNLRLNLGHGNRNLRLFEVAHTFFKDESSETHTLERSTLAFLLYGSRHPDQWPWQSEPADFLDLKGLVELFLQQLHLEEADFALKEHPYFRPAVSCTVQGKEVAELGRVNPVIAEEYDAQQDVWLAELDLEVLFAISSRQPVCFQELPKFPPVRRDITIIAPMELSIDQVKTTMEKVSPKLVEGVELTDIYHPDSQKERNITFRLTYRHPERTLKDKEVDKMQAAMTKDILKKLPVRV